MLSHHQLSKPDQYDQEGPSHPSDDTNFQTAQQLDQQQNQPYTQPYNQPYTHPPIFKVDNTTPETEHKTTTRFIDIKIFYINCVM